MVLLARVITAVVYYFFSCFADATGLAVMTTAVGTSSYCYLSLTAVAVALVLVAKK